MGKKISFVVLNHTGSSIKRASISKTILNGIGLLSLIFLVCMGWFACDYFSLKKNVAKNAYTEPEVVKAQTEIAMQRAQIQAFAKKMDDLKTRLVELNTLEEKIRIVANLETDAKDQGGLFGVGGSLPEDLDPKLDITESHHGLIREMHEQLTQLDEVANVQQERFKSLFLDLENKRNILSATPAIRPVDGWVTSRFGYRRSPFTNLREFHKGLDIAAKKGSPIFATANGVVTFSGKKGLMGLTIIINHGHGMVTRYGHAQKLLKKRGQKVKRGEVIAEIGNSGRSTGPHVHYEVLLNGVPVNPSKYILN